MHGIRLRRLHAQGANNSGACAARREVVAAGHSACLMWHAVGSGYPSVPQGSTQHPFLYYSVTYASCVNRASDHAE